MSEITINKTGPGSPNDAPAQDDKSVDSVQPSDGTLAKASPAKIDQKSSFSLLAWIRASRPTYFVATLVPLFLGFFAAARYESVYKPWFFILILVACFLVHLATNLANDLFESSSGIDTKDTIGGTKVIQEGKISPRQIKLALFLSYAAALVLAYFIVKDNKILWAMVIFAFLSSLFYVCPPIKYGHRGLGEVFVFINMGLIMTVGTYMALTDHFNPRVIALSLPVAVMVAGILYFQSLPEIETDKKAGKKTLAVILGPHRATFFQFIIWPIAWFLMINLWLTGLTTIWVLLGLITFPIHWLVMHRIRKTENWLSLDSSGYLIRIMYLINGLLLIVGVALLPPQNASDDQLKPNAPVISFSPVIVTPPPVAPAQPAAPAVPPTPPAEASAPPAAAPAPPAEASDDKTEPVTTPPAAAPTPAPPAETSVPQAVAPTPPAEASAPPAAAPTPPAAAPAPPAASDDKPEPVEPSEPTAPAAPPAVTVEPVEPIEPPQAAPSPSANPAPPANEKPSDMPGAQGVTPTRPTIEEPIYETEVSTSPKSTRIKPNRSSIVDIAWV